MKPDIVAPGVSIRLGAGGRLLALLGTSMRHARIGRGCVLLAAVPSLAGRVPETEELLRATAVRLTSEQVCGGVPGYSIPNPVFGWGRLDVAAAVSALSPRRRRRRRRRVFR